MSDLTSLVFDAPPGEIDAVRHDIEVLTGNTGAAKRKLAVNVQKSNVEQLRVVEVTVGGKKQLTVLSEYNQLEDSLFFTAGAKPVKFEVDHLTRKTTVVGDYEPEVDTTKYQQQVDKYVAQHFAAESVAAVFPQFESKFVIVVIGRKLNPQNFSNGQITALYTLDTSGGSLRGEISADVHYFEEGNVRMGSKKDVSASGVTSPAKLGEKLEALESKFQEDLNRYLVELNEREFKELRRQLPVTRMPMVWGKTVAGYKLGKELENR